MTDDTPATRTVRATFSAFQRADRAAIEALLAEDLRFSSPADPELDRAGYFARCWPSAGTMAAFAIERLIEAGDEVVVTYVATRSDGTRFRNTEVHTVAGDRVRRVEVYFGWDVD